MWKASWKKWTIDKPAILGDFLWDVFVVQLAASECSEWASWQKHNNWTIGTGVSTAALSKNAILVSPQKITTIPPPRMT